LSLSNGEGRGGYRGSLILLFESGYLLLFAVEVSSK